MVKEIAVGFGKLGERWWIIDEGEVEMFMVKLVVLVKPTLHRAKPRGEGHSSNLLNGMRVGIESFFLEGFGRHLIFGYSCLQGGEVGRRESNC